MVRVRVQELVLGSSAFASSGVAFEATALRDSQGPFEQFVQIQVFCGRESRSGGCYVCIHLKNNFTESFRLLISGGRGSFPPVLLYPWTPGGDFHPQTSSFYSPPPEKNFLAAPMLASTVPPLLINKTCR